MLKVDYELGISREDVASNNIDMWGASFVWGGDYCAEYNLCIDNGENYSAIYLVKYYEDGEWLVDTSCYKHYEVEWRDPDWVKHLISEMAMFLEANTGDWYYV